MTFWFFIFQRKHVLDTLCELSDNSHEMSRLVVSEIKERIKFLECCLLQILLAALTINDLYHSEQNSADQKLIFFLFFLKTGFDILCKSSTLETICMKCQMFGDNLHEMWNPVFWENNKNIINLSSELETICMKSQPGWSNLLNLPREW